MGREFYCRWISRLIVYTCFQWTKTRIRLIKNYLRDKCKGKEKVDNNQYRWKSLQNNNWRFLIVNYHKYCIAKKYSSKGNRHLAKNNYCFWNLHSVILEVEKKYQVHTDANQWLTPNLSLCKYDNYYSSTRNHTKSNREYQS